MKRLILLFLVAACGDGSTTNGDGGADAAADVTTNDATSEAGGDAAPSDGAVSDGSGGDGGLNGGDVCDPNNNQCKKGLLCCSEPTHMADAMTGYFCEVPVNKSCPLLP